MRNYKRRYTQGKVAPYAKKYKGKEGKLRWQGSIREGIVTEAVDEHGNTIRGENGSVKLVTKRRTLIKTFGDIDCVPYRHRGTTKYRGQREAEASFKEWRDSLLEQADADYEEALRLDESEAKAKEYNFASMTESQFVDLYIREREDDGLEASTLEGVRLLREDGQGALRRRANRRDNRGRPQGVQPHPQEPWTQRHHAWQDAQVLQVRLRRAPNPDR